MYGSLSALSGNTSFGSVNHWLTQTHLGARITALLARQGIRLADQIDSATIGGAKLVSGYAIEHSGEAASNLAIFVFHFGIALITLFYFLRDGESWGLCERLGFTPKHQFC